MDGKVLRFDWEEGRIPIIYTYNVLLEVQSRLDDFIVPGRQIQ